MCIRDRFYSFISASLLFSIHPLLCHSNLLALSSRFHHPFCDSLHPCTWLIVSLVTSHRFRHHFVMSNEFYLIQTIFKNCRFENCQPEEGHLYVRKRSSIKFCHNIARGRMVIGNSHITIRQCIELENYPRNWNENLSNGLNAAVKFASFH